MRPGPRYPRDDQDRRHSVAEQPGRLVFFVGVGIALILGLLIRGLLSPEKVKAHIETAAAQIHPSVKVEFDAAHLSLSKAFLPRVAIVIERVRLESSNLCWMSPRIFVDQLEIPISFLSILKGRPALGRFAANEVELRLREERPRSDCEEKNLAASEKTAEGASTPAPAVSLVRKAPRPEMVGGPGGDMESLSIRKLTVFLEKPRIMRFDFQSLEFLVRSSRPRVYQLKAQTQLLRDAVAAEWLGASQIHLEYKEFPDRQLDGRVFGNWREGYYSIAANYKSEDNKVRLSSELRHIPLGQVLALASRLGVDVRGFTPKQSWLSFVADSEGDVGSLQNLPTRVRSLRLEGDLGEFSFDQLEILAWKPFRMNPVRVDVKSLDLDRVLEFLGRPHPSPVLAKLGKFRGQLEVTSPEKLRLVGEHGGLQFVFSNQGQRELQSVSKISGEAQYQSGQWSLGVKSLELDQGSFVGEVRLKTQAGFDEVSLQLRSDELVLAPHVQRLMTRGGEIGSLKSQFQLGFRRGQLTSLQGQLRIPRLRMEGLEADRLALQVDNRGPGFQVRSQIESLRISAKSPSGEILGKVLPGSWLQAETYPLSTVSGVFDLEDFRSLKWSKWIAKGPGGDQMSTEGEWTSSGAISGEVLVRGKERRRWKLSGTRDLPVFESPLP